METAVAIKRLSVAFPQMRKEFWDLLAERISANGFSSERLKRAVENVLDNFQYRQLNISDIIRYDRRVKLYTGSEFMDAQIRGIHCSEFEKREVNGETYRVRKIDLLNQIRS
jgi:hypothetical protein